MQTRHRFGCPEGAQSRVFIERCSYGSGVEFTKDALLDLRHVDL
jgi:hypothetical protein